MLVLQMKSKKKMFLCRVASGYSEKGYKGLRRPPYIYQTKELSDSVEGTIGNEKMWCVFDTHQSYPEYVIDFKIDLNQLPRKMATPRQLTYHHIPLIPPINLPPVSMVYSNRILNNIKKYNQDSMTNYYKMYNSTNNIKKITV